MSYRKELVAVNIKAYTSFMLASKHPYLTVALLVLVGALCLPARSNDKNSKDTNTGNSAPSPNVDKKPRKLTPEEREALRQQISSAGKDIYPNLKKTK